MTRRYIVQGIVQGVGFRRFAIRTAQAFGVYGTVRNCDDGSVEIVANSDPQSLQAFVEQIGIGPPYGRVDRIRTEDLPEQHFNDFRTIG